MMKKGIAVPYIIALILGIVVVALLGYWFFILGGTFTGRASITECQTKLSTYCAAFAASGYDTAAFDPFTSSTCPASGTVDAPECCSHYSSLMTGASWTATCTNLIGQ